MVTVYLCHEGTNNHGKIHYQASQIFGLYRVGNRRWQQIFRRQGTTICQKEYILFQLGVCKPIEIYSVSIRQSGQKGNNCCHGTDNEHFGFGRGIHYCVRAPLARMKTQIASNVLVRVFVNPHHILSSQMTGRLDILVVKRSLSCCSVSITF
jgi:hypothetical protein